MEEIGESSVLSLFYKQGGLYVFDGTLAQPSSSSQLSSISQSQADNFQSLLPH